MWEFAFVIMFLSCSANAGVHQYLREVTYPNGPSQVLVQRPGQLALTYPSQQLVYSHQQPTQVIQQQPQQFVYYAEQPTQYIQQPQQLLSYVPPTQYVQQPQQVLSYAVQPPTQFIQQPQQLVNYALPPSTQVLHHPHQLVHFGQPLTAPVPVSSPVLGYHIHPQPQTVVPVAPEVHVEKHLVPAALTPVIVKKVSPVVTKEIIPEVTLIQQPILSKALFQRHIYNVKHGSEPIIVQDLCTVYPYQKNLRACALKKATLPELHHPDVRIVHTEASQHQADQSAIVPAPPTSPPPVIVMKTRPRNIQEMIRRQSTGIKAASTKKSETVAIAPVASSAQPETVKSTKPSRTEKSRRKKSKGSTSLQTPTMVNHHKKVTT